MALCGGLKGYRIIGCLLGMWLSNPAFLFSQRTTAFGNHANTGKLAPGLLNPNRKYPLKAWRVRINDKATFEQWTKQVFPAAIVQPSSDGNTVLVIGIP